MRWGILFHLGFLVIFSLLVNRSISDVVEGDTSLVEENVASTYDSSSSSSSEEISNLETSNNAESAEVAVSVEAVDTSTREAVSSQVLRFLVMGDWGTQTGSGKYQRKLYHDEPDSYELLAANEGENKNNNQNQNKNNNQNQNQNKNNNNNNNNKNGGAYWAVLVAQAMANYADINPCNFLIALGDNFYNNGVASTSDSLWTSLYTNVYYQDSLQIPWYAVFGNHDYGSNKGAGSLQAQIDFGVYKYDNRWNAGYCYMKSFALEGTSTTVDVVFVDSTLIAPEETYMTSTSAGVSAETQAQKQQEQLECAENYLKSSTASFLVVCGHYPIFSTGKNSPGDMTSMLETLYPLLEKYNVDVYFAGHDHRLEYLAYTTTAGSTMDFVISGAAGKPDNQLTSGITSAAESKFAAATGGFSSVEVSEGSMTINMIDYSGAVLYSFTRQQQREGGTASSASSSTSTTTEQNKESENNSKFKWWWSGKDGDEQQADNNNNKDSGSAEEENGENSQQANRRENVNYNRNQNSDGSKSSFSLSSFFNGQENPLEVAKYGLMIGCVIAVIILAFVASMSGVVGANTRLEVFDEENGVLKGTGAAKPKPGASLLEAADVTVPVPSTGTSSPPSSTSPSVAAASFNSSTTAPLVSAGAGITSHRASLAKVGMVPSRSRSKSPLHLDQPRAAVENKHLAPPAGLGVSVRGRSSNPSPMRGGAGAFPSARPVVPVSASSVAARSTTPSRVLGVNRSQSNARAAISEVSHGTERIPIPSTPSRRAAAPERKERGSDAAGANRHPILQHRNLHSAMNVSSRGTPTTNYSANNGAATATVAPRTIRGPAENVLTGL